MADAPKFGGPKPGGGKPGGAPGGSSSSGGAVGMIFFMFVLAAAIYVVSTQPIPIGVPGGRTVTVGSWLSGQKAPTSGRTDIPAGFKESQLSPNFKKVRIVSFIPAYGGQPAALGLSLTPGSSALALIGWQIQTRKGSQVIGPEGAASQNWRINIGSIVPDATHNRILLYDEQALLVDDFSY